MGKKRGVSVKISINRRRPWTLEQEGWEDVSEQRGGNLVKNEANLTPDIRARTWNGEDTHWERSCLPCGGMSRRGRRNLVRENITLWGERAQKSFNANAGRETLVKW